MTGRRFLPALLLLLLPAVGLAFWRIATRSGLGLSPDSVTYILMARHIQAGEGAVLFSGLGILYPVTHFPPLYPALLAAIAFISHTDPLRIAGSVQGSLWAANLILFALLLYRVTRSWFPTAAGVLLLAGAADLLQLHTMVWSEPLFLFLGFSGLLSLDRALETVSRRWLAVSGLLWAAATLTRYAGISWIATGLATLVLRRRSFSDRLWDLFFFGSFSVLPVSLWLLRNYWKANTLTHRAFAYHPFGIRNWIVLASNLSTRWLTNGPAPKGLTLFVGVLLLIFTVRSTSQSSSRFRRLLLLFPAVYVLLIWTMENFFSADILGVWEYGRMLSSAHIALLLTAAASLKGWTDRRPSFHWAARCAAAGLTVLSLWRGAVWAAANGEDAPQFAGRRWRQSSVLAHLQTLPRPAFVVSNVADPLALYAGLNAFDLPERVKPGTLERNSAFEPTMVWLGQKLKKEKGLVVYFSQYRLPNMPTDPQLQAMLPLRCIYRAADGAIYTAQ